MDIELVNPAIRDAVAELPPLNLADPETQQAANAAYDAMPAFETPGTSVDEVRREGVDVRIIRRAASAAATGPTGAVLWFHGGGFVIGNSKQDAVLLGRTTAELGIPTFSLNYPLAPAHRFPEILASAVAAWDWLGEHAGDYGVDPERIVIGGESAGAQIAASLAQFLQDRGGRRPAGQWLFAPATDDRDIAATGARAGDHFVIDSADFLALVPQITGHPAGSPEMPPYAFAAYRDDLAGLPPAWLYVGSIELFHDGVVAYARRLEAAGVPTELVVVPGAVHGFELLLAQSPLAQELMGQAIGWLGRLVG